MSGNQVVYWGRPPEGRSRRAHPSDAIYFATFFNTREGPIVVEVPPRDSAVALERHMVTIWQMPLRAGGLLGADRGAGGKYAVIPPGYPFKLSDDYVELHADGFGGCAFMRAHLAGTSEADVEMAIAFGKQMRVYPIDEAADPPATIFTDVSDLHPRRNWARRMSGSGATSGRTFDLMFPLYAPNRTPFEKIGVPRELD